MNRILFTEEFCQPENLYPFTLTRQIQDIRIGILTIREKWERMLELPSFDRRENDYKDLGRAMDIDECVQDGDCLMIHGNLLPTPALVKAVKALNAGQFLSAAGEAIVYRISKKEVRDKNQIRVSGAVPFEGEIKTIRYPWHIFQLNDWALRADFTLLTQGRKSQAVPRGTKTVNAGEIFIEKGARISHALLNASTGPIYIGRDAEVMEGSLIRGPFALGQGGCVKMGARIYGATSAGPYSILAGEVKNSVIFGYSNKAHDGYMGDSVIGEWCNWGAGTTNSNLKNNAGTVRVWTQAGEMEAGFKCGVLMGDYSRASINTAINTGTVIGVCCHVSGTGLTPKYIPNFSWGSEGVKRYEWNKALQDIEGWKKLKNETLTDEEKSILKYIFDHLA